MIIKRFCSELIRILTDVKNNGSDVVEIDSLVEYLESVASISDPATEQKLQDAEITIKIESFKARELGRIEDRKAINASRLELFRSTIVAGQGALRAFFLLNGGACIAILAFIGNIIDPQSPSSQMIGSLSSSLENFLYGTASISGAAATTYLGQFFYGNHNDRSQRVGHIFAVITILLGAVSLVFFLVGVSVGINAIGR